MKIQGLIFDFDGLILDTETPDLTAWMSIYSKYEGKFDFKSYISFIGKENQWHLPVEQLILQKPTLNKYKIFEEWQQIEKELIEKQPISSGVLDYLKKAKELGLKVGIASSSDRAWVSGHLMRLNIQNFFDTIHTVDDTGIPKPDPALYSLTLKSLGLCPKQVIAFEDSPNGISAAKAAGIYCVAVPNPVTNSLGIDHADLIINSLDKLSLIDLLNKFV